MDMFYFDEKSNESAFDLFAQGAKEGEKAAEGLLDGGEGAGDEDGGEE